MLLGRGRAGVGIWGDSGVGGHAPGLAGDSATGVRTGGRCWHACSSVPGTVAPSPAITLFLTHMFLLAWTAEGKQRGCIL